MSAGSKDCPYNATGAAIDAANANEILSFPALRIFTLIYFNVSRYAVMS
jgi:hypothetical protein